MFRSSLLAKQATNPPQYTVLLGVVWVVFARNFEDRRKGSSVGVNPVAYFVCDLRELD